MTPLLLTKVTVFVLNHTKLYPSLLIRGSMIHFFFEICAEKSKGNWDRAPEKLINLLLFCCTLPELLTLFAIHFFIKSGGHNIKKNVAYKSGGDIFRFLIEKALTHKNC